MRNRILTTLLAAACCCLFFTAKADPITYNGTKGNLTIFSEYTSTWPTQITENNKYVVFSGMGIAAGIVYDLDRDTVLYMFDTLQPVSCANQPNMLVGNIKFEEAPGAGEFFIGVIIKDGKKIELQGLRANQIGGGDVNGIKSDGSLILANPLKADAVTSAAGLWDSTGNFLRYLPYYFSSDPLAEKKDTRPYGMSPDGRIVYGWGTWNDVQRTPMYWVDEQPYIAFKTDDGPLLYTGELYGCNQNNNILAGCVGEQALLYCHGSTPKRLLVDPLPTFNNASFQSLSDDTVAVGYTEREFGDRAAMIYTPFYGGMLLTDYLKELYGLNVDREQLLQACQISNDGRIITGQTLAGGEYVPFLIRLDAEQILPRPRFLSGIQSKTTTSVSLKWHEPITSKDEVIGYNIYLDNFTPESKLNSALITSLQFITTPLETGIHSFFVSAVYKTSGESDTCKPISLRIIGSDDCYPIKSLSAGIKYNSAVSLLWDIPSSTGEKIGAQGEPTEGYDLINIQDIKSQLFSIARIGDYYYMVSYNGFDIVKFDKTFTTVGNIIVPNSSTITNFAAVGENLIYAVNGNNKNIQVINLESKEVVDNLTVVTDKVENLSHITYIPTGDNGKGALEVGSFTKSFVVNLEGEVIGEGISPSNVLGTAYSNGIFYSFENYVDSYCILNTYNWEDKTLISSYDLLSNPKIYTTMYGQAGTMPNIAAAGGICISTLEDGTTALACVLQGMYVLNHIAMLELKPSENILGYNLFRNGEKINSKPIIRRAYNDILNTAGNYIYNVSAINSNGCLSDTSANKALVVIAPHGECNPANTLSAVESDSAVMLTFSVNEDDWTNLAGFNIYRDNVLLKELHLATKYTDKNPGAGRHTYRVESFYQSACTASDSISIDLDFQGAEQAPTLLTASSTRDTDKQTFTVDLNWNLPFYDASPLEIRYGSGACAYGFSLPNITDYYALIGWDSAALTSYRDLVLVGMQVFMTDEVTEFSSVVFLNNKIAYNNTEGRIKVGSEQNIFFKEVFPMDQPTSVELGYHIIFKQGAKPSGLDIDPAVSGYGDIFTLDLKEFGYLKKDAGTNSNWCIAGLVARYRDLEAAGTDWQNNDDFLNSLQNVKITSAAHKLTGFNIYRDGKKINSSPQTERSFKDLEVSVGEHDYTVGAVYASGEEKISEGVFVDLVIASNDNISKQSSVRFSPNPAHSQITTVGEFKSLSITDLQGKQLKNYKEKASVFSLSGLGSGTYLLHFTLPDGQVSTQKLIIR